VARILKSAIAPHRGGAIILFEVFDMRNKRQPLFTLIWVVVNEVTMWLSRPLGLRPLQLRIRPITRAQQY
jgi:hypothetical protein